MANNIFGNIGNAIGGAIQGVGNFIGNEAQQFTPAVQNFAQQAGQALAKIPNMGSNAAGPVGQAMNIAPQVGKSIQQAMQGVNNYFDPTANAGQGFWSSPVAQGMGAAQPHAENFLQGASLGYYQPNQQDVANMNPFVASMERQAGGMVPLLAVGAATGGIGDAAIAPEVFGEGMLPGMAATAARGGINMGIAGGITGAASNAPDMQTRLQNAEEGMLSGAAFGAGEGLNEISPLLSAGANAAGGYGLTKLQGGSDADAQAAGVMGLASPLGYKFLQRYGMGDTSPIKAPKAEADIAKEVQQKQQFQQRNPDLVSPEGRTFLLRQLEQASANQPQLHDVLDTVAQQVQGRTISAIKDPLSTIQKVDEHRVNGEKQYGLNDVNDILRGSLIVKNQGDVPQSANLLRQEFQNRGYQVSKEQNYFEKPGENDYEGYHMDIRVPNPDGSYQQAEIQIHTPQSWANARLTHNAYSQFDGKDMPDNIKRSVTALQKTIKTDPVSNIESVTQQDELSKLPNTISPMSSDFTGDEPALTHPEQILKELKDANPQLDYEHLQGQVDQIRQQRQQVLQQHLNNNKQQISGAQSLEAPNNHYLNNLLRMRQGIQSQIKPEQTSTPEIDSIIAERDRVAKQQQNAKFTLDNYDDLAKTRDPSNPLPPKTAISKQYKVIADTTKKYTAQIKSMQAKLKGDTTDQNARIKAQMKDFDQQITKEQTRLKVQNTLDQAPTAQQSAQIRTPEAMAGIQQPETQTTPPPTAQTAQLPTARDGYQRVSAQLAQEHNMAFNPQDMGAKLRGFQNANRDVGDIMQKQIDADLTKPEATQTLEALSDKNIEQQLNPKQQEALQQWRQVLDQASQIRASRDPQYQAIDQGYAPMTPKGIDNVKDPALKRYLSQYSPENQHRVLWGFDPVNGGESKIGAPGMLGLKQTAGGTTFEDAQGNQYLMRPMTRAEGRGLGLDYENDAGKVMKDYINHTLQFKTNADLVNAMKTGQYGAMATADRTPGYIDGSTINPDLKGTWLAPQLANAIKATQHQETTNPFAKAAQGVSTLIRDSLLTNFIRHPGNQEVNGLIGAADLGPQGTADFVKNQAWAVDAVRNKTDDYLNMTRQGIGTGGFRDNGNKGLFQTATDSIFKDSMLSKVAGVADKLNPVRGLLQANHKVVGLTDDVVRMSLMKSAIDRGMEPDAAAQHVRNFLVDYGDIGQYKSDTVNTFDKILNKSGIFYPYLKGETKALLTMGRNPSQHMGSIVMSAALVAATVAADKAFQSWSGNQDAHLPHFGLPALAMEYGQAPGEIMQGQIPTAIASHINPLLGEGANQLANNNYTPNLLSANKQPIVKPGDQNKTGRLGLKGSIAGIPLGMDVSGDVADRAGHLATLIGPDKYLASGMEGKKTPGEIAMNFVAGATTPHLKGFQATPNNPTARFLGIPGLDLNAQGAKPNTGMDIIKNQQVAMAKLSPQEQSNLAQIKTDEANAGNEKDATKRQNMYKEADMLLANDPKLLAARSQIEQTNARVNGIPLSPIYDPKNANVVSDYLNYRNMSYGDQANYVAKNPDVLDMERQIDTYNNNPATQQYKQQLAQQLGYQYKPSIANPLFANDPQSGQPKFSNQDIAAYSVYKSMPSQTSTDSLNKAQFLANHPQIMQAQIASQPYEVQKLQSAWDTRPTGQTPQQFAANSKSSLFGGIDQNGKVIPAYDVTQEPKYQLAAVNPQAGAIYQIYSAAMSTKDYSKADGLAAQYPWISTVHDAQKQYTASHPFNSEANNSLGGLGINFSAATKSGSGYGSSSGSSNYMDQYVERQAIYGALHDTIPQVKNIKLTRSTPGTRGGSATTSPLKSYYGQQQQLMSKLTTSMPKLTTAPKLVTPKVSGGKINFKLSPSVPSGTNEHVQAGRMTSRLQ